MKAQVGDRLVVAGTRAGDGDRIGVVTEIVHEDGSPPYRVRWQDNGHEVLIYPGAGCPLYEPRTAPPVTAMFVNLPGVGLNRGVGLYRATSRDADAFTTSQVRTFGHDRAWAGLSRCGSREWNRTIVAEALCYEVTLEGRVVGGLIVTRPGLDHFHIVRIWVEPDYQGRGIGSRALALLEASHRQACLWTVEAPAWAHRHRRFYQRNGFQVIRESGGTVHFGKRRPGILRLRSLP